MMAPNRRKGYPRDDLWLRHRPREERVKKWTLQARCRYYALSHPNSGLPEFGHSLNRPKSDKSDFGCGRGQLVFCRINDWVRGSCTKPLTHSDSWAHHCALSRTQVGLARLAQHMVRIPGKPGMRGRGHERPHRPASLDHDLDRLAGIGVILGTKPVEDPEALDRAVGDRHAARQALDRVAGCDGHDLDVQRLCRLAFRQRHATEGADRFAKGAIDLRGRALGGEDETIDVATEPHRIEPKHPLVALGGCGRCWQPVDCDLLDGFGVDV